MPEVSLFSCTQNVQSVFRNVILRYIRARRATPSSKSIPTSGALIHSLLKNTFYLQNEYTLFPHISTIGVFASDQIPLSTLDISQDLSIDSEDSKKSAQFVSCASWGKLPSKFYKGCQDQKHLFANLALIAKCLNSDHPNKTSIRVECFCEKTRIVSL